VKFKLPKDLSRCCGTIQLTALGKWLEKSEYLFWNLGHPPRRKTMKYKKDLGGKVYPRSEFLSRWRSGRDENGVIVGDEFNFNDITSSASS
jgi:hypothetical protein